MAAFAPVRVPADRQGGPRTIAPKAGAGWSKTMVRRAHGRCARASHSAEPAWGPAPCACRSSDRRPDVQELAPMSGRRLAMFPLSTVLYPHADLPLHVFEPRYRKMMTDCLAADGTFGIVLIDRGSEVGGGDHRVAVGTVARIRAASPQPDGRWVLLARGAERIRVLDWHDDEPYPVASVEPLPEEEVDPTPEDLDRTAQRVRRVPRPSFGAGQPPSASGRRPRRIGTARAGLAPVRRDPAQHLRPPTTTGGRGPDGQAGPAVRALRRAGGRHDPPAGRPARAR